MREYMALIRKDHGSDYGVDFPGCISAGLTAEDAVAMGREALAGHIGVMVDSGEGIPEPPDSDAILAEPGNRHGLVALFLVSAPRPTGKSIRVNITIPEASLRRIDEHIGKLGVSRSSFLVKSALTALEH